MELTDKSGNSNRAIMFNGGDRIEEISQRIVEDGVNKFN